MPKKTTTAEPTLKSSLDFTDTRTDQLTVWIVRRLGSMYFLVTCILFFIFWAIWNLNIIPMVKPFDPFPFSVLDMVVSLFAIILSVLVLINQNRQSQMEQIRKQVEFEVNVRAEDEITKVLTMVHEIHQHLGLYNKSDKELEKMKEPTDIKEIHHKLDKQEPSDKASE